MNTVLNNISDYKELTTGLSDYVKPVKKETYRAYCNSMSCAKTHMDYKLGKAKLNVSRSSMFCPDCGSALFWAGDNLYKKYI